ncbi:MAG: protein kinase [Kofleriaceae bacterium]
MTCPSAEQLASLVEGRSDAAGMAHVEACATCRDVVRMLADAGVHTWSLAEGTRQAVSPAPGEQIGRYVVLRAVAQGGMGEVFLGYDPLLDRNLALKLVRGDRGGSASFAARLEREAQVLAKLAHPNVVRVFDAGTWRGAGYVAMEYLHGESARSWCRATPRSPQQIVRVFAGAARGIGAAHALGVVHRDVKPDNILVGEDGVGRIADFGLVAGDVPAISTSGRSQVSTAAGTLGYRAPEVVAGGAADARSDQWSLCAALREMLLGGLPSSAGVPSSGARTRVPAATLRALRRGLAADPAKRFASIDELAAALEHRNHRGFVIAGLALAAATVGGFLAVSADSHDPLAHCDAVGQASVSAVEPLRSESFIRRFDMFGAASGQRRGSLDHAVTSYTARLSASAVAACRAQRSTPSAAVVQHECIANRKRELTALVTALQATDRAGLEEAPLAITKLTDPALCDDPARLATILPIDPAKRGEANRIADDVAAGRSRLLLGDRAELVPLARDLVDRADRLGVATITLSATSLLADLLGNAGQLTAAIDANLTAARHAATAHDDRALAQRFVRAADIAALDSDTARARALISAAEVIVNRVDDRALRDDLDGARSELAIQRGDASDVIATVRQNVDRARARYGPASAEYHRRMYQLARALRSAGKLDEARDVARAGIADVASNLGADHPAMQVYVSQLGRIASETGDLVGARHELERALALTRATYGEDSLMFAEGLGNLAAVLTLQGDARRAVELGERAVALYDRHGGTKNLAGHLGNLGTAYLEVGRTREGLATLERVLAMREQQFGTHSPELLRPLVTLGVAHMDARQPDGARRHWGRAVAIAQTMTMPPDFMVDTMRELAGLVTDRRERTRMLGDADALERRHAAAREANKP